LKAEKKKKEEAVQRLHQTVSSDLIDNTYRLTIKDTSFKCLYLLIYCTYSTGFDIQFNSILYYFCAVSRATRAITDTAQ
jgi:hypothetical protein